MTPTTMMFSRRRMESVRSTSSITPADELTSWLPDDVCVTCHAQVKAGQLYCSQECREEDAKASQAEMAKTSRLAPVTVSSSSSSQSSSSMRRSEAMDLTPSSAPLSSSHQNKEATPSRVSSGDAISLASSRSPAMNQKENNRTRTGSLVQSQPEEKFRYPCPPSPNILAKYGSHLTSPALAALDRKSSQLQQTVTTSEREFLSSSSEEDSTNGANVQQKKSARRSSSRSTFSSASEAAFSTDPSTPSPAVRSTLVDDEDDFEPTDLNLPPSVHPVTSTMVNSRDRRSPALKKANLPSNPPIVKRERVTMMSFARRPSRTNLPAPVLFTSPILATTVMKKASPHTKEANLHHQSGTTPPASSTRFARRGSDYGNGAVIFPSSMDKIDERTMKRMSPTLMMKHSSVNAVPVKKQGINTQSNRKSPSSPPQIASASSSAGKTLRAISPAPNFSTVSLAAGSIASITPESGFICGRYGCKGLSGSVEGISPKSINGQLQDTKVTDEQSGRRTMLLGHKHTHSAIAGLSLMGQAVAEDRPSLMASNANTEKLQMTSLSQKTEDDESGLEDLERTMKSPPRGRSKARGRSSTSRRSPSPPRGAARRGRSEDMLSSKEFSVVPLNTQPFKVPVMVDGTMSHDADDEKEERRGRRGRSPIERGRMFTQNTNGVKGVDVSLGRLRIEEANETAKQAPSPLDTPGSVSEVSVSDSTGYDEVDMDGL